jgi:hypothetical protein
MLWLNFEDKKKIGKAQFIVQKQIQVKVQHLITKHHTWIMTTCWWLNVESCTQQTIAVMYNLTSRWPLSLGAESKGGSFFNKAWVDAVWKTRFLYLSIRYTYHFTWIYKLLGFQEIEASRISRKSAFNVSQSVICTHPHTYPPVHMLGTHFHCCLKRSPGHSETRNIVSIKNLTNPMVNQTRNLQDSIPLRQPTVPPINLFRFPCNSVSRLMSFCPTWNTLSWFCSC